MTVMMEIEKSDWLQYSDNKYVVQKTMMEVESHSYIAKDRRKRSYSLSMFPTELLFRVFEYLFANEANMLMEMAICRDWREIERDESLWRLLCQYHWSVPERYCGSLSWRSLHNRLVRDQYVLEQADHLQMMQICNQHVALPNFQQIGCSKIGNLALQEDFRIQVGNSGGIAVVLNAMRTHVDNATVQEEACKTLVVLARPLGGAEGKSFVGREDILTNVNAIGQQGGVHLVLEAMKNHPHSAVVQANGCWALVNLALVTNHKILIVEQNGVSLILNAMRNHPNEAEVQYRACFVLVNLAIPEANKSMIVDQGGIALVIAAMKLHPKHAMLQHRACLVLRNLAFRHDNRPVLRREGAVEMIKMAMSLHPTDEMLQVACYNALNKI
eukprot:GILJ01002530.1.p1 GENE.GILJ01002530.1~~GILJ01002530.1.p1  ORF type:complete len:385 (+),score=57.92 GILJ01002530.1:270-1424(+)